MNAVVIILLACMSSSSLSLSQSVLCGVTDPEPTCMNIHGIMGCFLCIGTFLALLLGTV
jgi:hypothetical protein